MSFDHTKLKELLNTQAAIDAGVPGMSDADAASWCNGNQPTEGASLLTVYQDIEVGDLSQEAGFERGIEGNLARALNKHKLGHAQDPKVDQLTDNDWRGTYLLLQAMNSTERRMRCLRTGDQQQHGNLDSLLQGLVDASVIGAGDKQFIMNMAVMDTRPCDLDPATVDNNGWERVLENWIRPASSVEAVHVNKARALP